MGNGQLCLNAYVTAYHYIFHLLIRIVFQAKRRCPPLRILPEHSFVLSEQILLFQNDPQQIIVGSRITVSCMDNYRFETTRNLSVAIYCQNDGTWGPIVNCQCEYEQCRSFVSSSYCLLSIF
jgi:hypothetical protein